MKPKVLDGLVLAYGILLIVLGIAGYVISTQHGKPSIISLIAGCASGALVLVFLFITAKNPRVGRIGTAVLTLAMAGQFVPKALKSLNEPPATPVWHVWTIAVTSVIVFLLLGYGHMAATRARKLG